MKTVALGLFAISVGAVGGSGAASPIVAVSEAQAAVGSVVRSSHPAIDRILSRKASFQNPNYEKSFDRDYAKVWNTKRPNQKTPRAAAPKPHPQSSTPPHGKTS